MSNVIERIHPTAVIHPSAKLAADVCVGPYALVGENVTIGEGTVIDAHAYIKRNSIIGVNNRILSFAVLGGDPAHKAHQVSDETWLEMGDHNVIHEYAVIHRGASVCGGVTRLGSHNYIMCHAHIGHDCQVGNHVIMVNNSGLAGSVILDDYAYIGGYSGVVQHLRIGTSALLGIRSVVKRSVLPFMIVEDDKVVGVNKIGMERRGMTKDDVAMAKSMYRLVCRNKLTMAEVKKQLSAHEPHHIVECIAQFIESASPVSR